MAELHPDTPPTPKGHPTSRCSAGMRLSLLGDTRGTAAGEEITHSTGKYPTGKEIPHTARKYPIWQGNTPHGHCWGRCWGG